jgi:hypothetical protein
MVFAPMLHGDMQFALTDAASSRVHDRTSAAQSVAGTGRKGRQMHESHDPSLRRARVRAGRTALPVLTATLLFAASAAAEGTLKRGQEYIDECTAAGVPAPPPFNYDDALNNRNGTQWVYAGPLDDPFISTGLDADVFYHETPDGVCIALPRSDTSGAQTIRLLGVICQGTTTSKACFYDQANIARTQTVPATGFISGADLLDKPGGVCTDCHSGQNIFLLHPLSNLGLNIPRRMPSGWVDPIVVDDPDWPQNDGPTDMFDGAAAESCLACHLAPDLAPPNWYGGRFPEVSSATATYCSVILQRAFGRTMPPGEVGPLDPATHPPYEALLDACMNPPAPDDNLADQLMSFDFPNLWATQSGTLTLQTAIKNEGAGSTSVNASNFVRIDSAPFASWFLESVGDQILLDVYVPPAGQPNPFWLGAVQLYVNIPGANMINRFIAQVELTPGGTGWRTAVFNLPSAVRQELLRAHGDVRFGIAVNTPSGAPPVLLDDMRFAGALTSGANPPDMHGVRHDFERTVPWEGRDGIVTSTIPSSDVGGFNSSMALRINIAGGSEGRAWTVPSESPARGSTLTYRVYIPSAVPLRAISPYVIDGNGQWRDSWNTNLPRDTWVTLQVTVPTNATVPLQQLGLKVYLNGSYNGPIYVDSIGW